MKDICTEKIFLKDVAEHQMIILRHEGLYRHIRFKRPNTINMSFDLITWPGHLCYTGDMGTYVFCRLEDMFQFFRSSHPCQPEEDTQLSINPSYWAEKLAAVDRADGLREYSSDKFRDYFVEWMNENEASTELQEEIEDNILAYAEDGPEEAIKAAMEFEYEDEHLFTDFQEISVETYTFRYLWCCYAMVWGINKYDKAKQRSKQ